MHLAPLFTYMDIFCKIVKKQIPSKIIYEDKNFLAFLDKKPFSDGHTILIPKKHFEDIHDIEPGLLKKIFIVAAKISKNLKKYYDGTVIMHNSGKLRDVPHFHIHIYGKNLPKK